jgi:hypothetical protein
MDNARQAGGGQHDKGERWMTQDERVADNVARSGGKQREATWRWMTRQEEGGGGHNTGLSGGGRHSKRGEGKIVTSVAVHLEWKTTRGIGKQGRRVQAMCSLICYGAR